MNDTPKLIAFHGSPAIKAQLLEELREHAAHDRIVKGQYWENGKGCAVGCTIQGDDHSLYESRLGIPKQIAHLEDVLFEALPNEDAMRFPIEFIEAIPVGADLSLVVSNLMYDLLTDNDFGLLALPDLAEDVKTAIEAVAKCYRRRLSGDEPSKEEWSASGELAWDAWDARAAWDAWDARDARDARAAWAARDARDARDARAAQRRWQRDRLLHHLANAPVPESVDA